VKKILPILFVLLALSIILAEEQALIKPDTKQGGFGASVFKFTSIADEFSFVLGARGGWVIEQIAITGIGTYVMLNPINARTNGQHLFSNGGCHRSMNLFDSEPIDTSSTDRQDDKLGFAYVGFELGLTYPSNDMVHFVTNVHIGSAISLFYNFKDFEIEDEDWDNFFLLEIEVGLEANITNNFRIALTGGYRFVSNVGLEYYSNSDFSGYSLNLACKFGKNM